LCPVHVRSNARIAKFYTLLKVCSYNALTFAALGGKDHGEREVHEPVSGSRLQTAVEFTDEGDQVV